MNIIITNKKKLLPLSICFLLLVTMYGCSSSKNIKGVSKDIYKEGTKYAEVLYSIKDDYDNYKKYDTDEVYNFLNQKLDNEVDEEFIKLVGVLYVLNSMYLAAHVSKNDQSIEETVKNMDEIVDELKDKYGVEF